VIVYWLTDAASLAIQIGTMFASARTERHTHASFAIQTRSTTPPAWRCSYEIVLLESVQTGQMFKQSPITAIGTAMPAMQKPIGNRLLSKLGRAAYHSLQPTLEHVTLQENQMLYDRGDAVSHIYFPNDAIVSLLIEINGGRTVEIAMEGNESAVGLAIYLGGSISCNLASVRHAGTAMRLPVSALSRNGDKYGELDDIMRRYVHALCMQIAQLGVCNRFHSFNARLARWLLMTHDRTGTLKLHATQISIAQMLGVRRSTVTDAASGLLKQNIIDYRRGRIEILDPARLRDASCPCYGIIKRQYDSFLE